MQELKNIKEVIFRIAVDVILNRPELVLLKLAKEESLQVVAGWSGNEAGI